MKEINWCKKQTGGIKLVEPSKSLCEEYYKNAEESLKVLRYIFSTQSNMWLATTKYYIEYLAVYAILMRLGIKCEIHDCTISLVKLLESQGIFDIGTYLLLEKDKGLRIDNQYYLKNKPVIIDFDKLSAFLLGIKQIIINLSEDKIEEIRKKIEE